MVLSRIFLRELLRDATFDFSKVKSSEGWWALYKLYLCSPAWQKKREARLILDGHRCTSCGSGKRLEVHHDTYANVGHERLEDLRTLCYKCHKKKHENKTGIHSAQHSRE